MENFISIFVLDSPEYCLQSQWLRVNRKNKSTQSETEINDSWRIACGVGRRTFSQFAATLGEFLWCGRNHSHQFINRIYCFFACYIRLLLYKPKESEKLVSDHQLEWIFDGAYLDQTRLIEVCALCIFNLLILFWIYLVDVGWIHSSSS